MCITVSDIKDVNPAEKITMPKTTSDADVTTAVLPAGPKEERKINLIDFNKVTRKYVFIDDNHPPYQITNLEDPCKTYYLTDERWHDCKITNIIVPLYPKIYLEANRATHNFFQYLKNTEIGLQDSATRVVKVFLASSRSYKEYLALNKSINNKIKYYF